AVDALPDIGAFGQLRIKQALTDGPAWFDPGAPALG
ncbi:NUDIX hydrolase, partial [Streptomyces sp. TRM76130]|nr:NUDIX hydrolase [Streptomyces sp. TRM76130]